MVIRHDGQSRSTYKSVFLDPSPDGFRHSAKLGVGTAQTTRLLTSLFGIGPFRFVEWPDRKESKYYYRGVEEQIRLKQAFVQLGDVEVELIQPLEGRNAYQDFLDQTGGGIHHVLFEVPDIDRKSVV